MADKQDIHIDKDAKLNALLKDLMAKLLEIPVSVCKTLWKIGVDNPKRVIHSIKVGVALTLVSFLYLLEPLYEGFGQSAMWAVMTVVVVLEYTAGATLCKGLNRGIGTICAGLLAFFVEEVAEDNSIGFRAAFIGSSVFVVGFVATYVRFIPNVKKNYDYGVLIFILTFNLITVSSFRVHDIVGLARDRFYTIAIGCSICLIMSLLILPIWSGEDLHNSTVNKLNSLANSIEACIEEYFEEEQDTNIAQAKESHDLIDKGYREVLDSKSSDESLAHFASWEPICTRRFRRYPWNQYVKLGVVLRHLAYTAVALHDSSDSQIQAPRSIRVLFQDPCIRIAREASNVLSELSISLKDHRRFSPEILRNSLHAALQDLNSSIKSQPKLFLGSKSTNKKGKSRRITIHSAKSDDSLSDRSKRVTNSGAPKQRRLLFSKIGISSLEFSEALPFAAFSSLLVEMVARLDLVIDEVDKLGKAANFKEYSGRDDVVIHVNYNDKRKIQRGNELENHHLVSQTAE